MEWNLLTSPLPHRTKRVSVVIGASAFGVREMARIFSGPDDILEILFTASYAGIVASASVALFFFMRAIALQDVQLAPAGDEIRAHFRSNTYVDVLYSMGLAFLDAAERNTEVVNRKFSAAARGYRVLQATAFFVLIAANSYFWIAATEASGR